MITMAKWSNTPSSLQRRRDARRALRATSQIISYGSANLTNNATAVMPLPR